MNFTDLHFITDMMTSRKMGYFKVLAKDGKTIINEVDADEFNSEKDSVSELQRTILAQEPGEIVFVKISARSKKDKGDGGLNKNYEYRVRCNEDGKKQEKNNFNNNQAAINGDVLRLLEEKKALELKIQNLEHKSQMDELQRQISEIKEASPVEKYFPAIIGYLQNNGNIPSVQNSVAGINGTEETETPVDAKKVITIAINRLFKIDKNLPETLTQLANFAEKDPAKYNSFLPILKSM